MLSLGAAAYTKDKKLVSTFEVNLSPLEGAVGHPDTMAWWLTQPEAYEYATKAPVSPEKAMKDFSEWLDLLPGKPVFVAYPAGFDFMFVYWYLIKFTGKSQFSHSALDIKSYASAMLKKPYRDSTKRNFPKKWFDPLPHTHKALDDAIEQGAMFINMLKDNQ
jgi:DNA polymerase III alpha subunit (gram-positive type)